MSSKVREMVIKEFVKKQKKKYKTKKKYAAAIAYEFKRKCEEIGKETYVSVGGLDSITLFLFLYSIGIKVKGASVSSLEGKGIQKIHEMLGIEKIKAAKDKDGKQYTKVRILNEFGFPILSKEISRKIQTLQHPTDKNKTVRHAIITGETGEYGGWQKNSKMKLPKKYLDKFGGYENENENVNYGKPDKEMKISDKCCWYLKEKPCQDWAKKNNAVPYEGLMASEGGRRSKALMANGCNYFGKTTIRSAPFAIFSRHDLLRLALEMDKLWKEKLRYEFEERAREEGRLKENEHFQDTIIPEEYGEIKVGKDKKLYTTKAQRTGCTMCGYGIHLEKRPHRFDRLKEENIKEWEFWMYKCVTDGETGEKYGFGRILDYIGVEWETDYKKDKKVIEGQIKMDI